MLKALKTRQKIWNKTSFGNLAVEKKEALKKVKTWDALEEKESSYFKGKRAEGRSCE